MSSRADRIRSWGLGVWAALALIYLFVPVFIVVLFSFNDPHTRGFTHWKSVSGIRSSREAGSVCRV